MKIMKPDPIKIFMLSRVLVKSQYSQLTKPEVHTDSSFLAKPHLAYWLTSRQKEQKIMKKKVCSVICCIYSAIFLSLEGGILEVTRSFIFDSSCFASVVKLFKLKKREQVHAGKFWSDDRNCQHMTQGLSVIIFSKQGLHYTKLGTQWRLWPKVIFRLCWIRSFRANLIIRLRQAAMGHW